MYTSPEEQKIADLRELPIQTEIELLRNNVKELQLQLNAAHIRIKELLTHVPETEEELVRKVMIARGINPDDSDEVISFWSEYHGIKV